MAYRTRQVRTSTRYARPEGTVTCALGRGKVIRIPLATGILKHPVAFELRRLLKNPDVVRKYTREALKVAPWHILREFPGHWLLQCLRGAGVRPSRDKAIRFILRQRKTSPR